VENTSLPQINREEPINMAKYRLLTGSHRTVAPENKPQNRLDEERSGGRDFIFSGQGTKSVIESDEDLVKKFPGRFELVDDKVQAKVDNEDSQKAAQEAAEKEKAEEEANKNKTVEESAESEEGKGNEQS